MLRLRPRKNTTRFTDFDLRLVGKLGQAIFSAKKKVTSGINTINLAELNKYSNAVFTIELFADDKRITQQLIIWN